MSLPPYHYRWTWKWHAEGKYITGSHVPNETEIQEYMNSKVGQKLIDTYVSKGHQIFVVQITTGVTRKFLKLVPYGKDRYMEYYAFDGTTTTDYYTNLDAKVGSPIDPITVSLIAAVLTFIVGIATLAFKWYIFQTAVNTLTDIAKGIEDGLGKGLGGGGGILIIMVIIIVAIVFLMFWTRRKKKR